MDETGGIGCNIPNIHNTPNIFFDIYTMLHRLERRRDESERYPVAWPCMLALLFESYLSR